MKSSRDKGDSSSPRGPGSCGAGRGRGSGQPGLPGSRIGWRAACWSGFQAWLGDFPRDVTSGKHLPSLISVCSAVYWATDLKELLGNAVFQGGYQFLGLGVMLGAGASSLPYPSFPSLSQSKTTPGTGPCRGRGFVSCTPPPTPEQ